MDYRPTHKQFQDREQFSDVASDARNIAATCFVQPNLTPSQRKACEVMIAAANTVRAEFAQSREETA